MLKIKIILIIVTVIPSLANKVNSITDYYF